MRRSSSASMPRASSPERTSRRRNQLLIALLCGAASLLASCRRFEHLPSRVSDDTVTLTNVQYSTGDSQRHWIDSTTYDLPTPPVVLWLRTNVTIPPRSFETRTAGIFVSALATCDVFWDGKRIGTTRNIDNFLPLEHDAAREGTHVLTLRVDAPPLPAGATAWFYGIGMGDYAAMVRSRIVSQIIPMIVAGAFVIAAAWYLAMWISMRRRASVLVFAVLCCAAALLDFTESYRALFNYPFEWHIVRLRAILTLTFAVCLLLPLFLALEMGVRHAWIRVAAFAPLLLSAAITADSHDGAALAMFSSAMIACTTVVGSALPRKRWDALPAAAGVAILTMSLAAGGYRFGDSAFFLAFTLLILCLLLSLSIDLGRAQRQHQAVRLRAARLETELLKKSIHPHFVMNTLTAVMEWIEENPRQGVRFLESLADELRIFLDIASRPLIPLEKELALCRAHLRIMSCRKATQFQLQTDDVRSDGVIPPAIFHTLVENAISHNAYEGEVVSFRLREERAGDSRRYVFSAPLRDAVDESRGGLGMRYVKARLEETYPGRWNVESFADGDQWQTAIEVPA